MCKYQSIKENNVPLCEVTGGLCDFCVFGDNRHLALVNFANWSMPRSATTTGTAKKSTASTN